MRQSKPRILIGIAAAVLVAAACTPGTTPPGAGQSPAPGGRVVGGSTADIKTLQPVLSSDTASSGVWQFIYLGLTRPNKDTTDIECQLCERFSVSQDGLTLTYTLLDGLVWSDGVAFTGEDYKYTAEAVMRSKKTIRKGIFSQVVGARDYEQGKTDTITGITVGDNGKTITIKFTTPFCPAISQLGSMSVAAIPKHHFIKDWNNKTTDTAKNIDDSPLNIAPPASIGPFVFKEYKPGDQVRLARNDKYFKGAPFIDEYIVKVYADATAIKAALLTGEITHNTVEPKDYDEASRTESLKGFRFPSFSTTYIGWNPNNPKAPWLANKDVRQALSYGLNMDLIMEKVIFKLGKRIYAHTPPAQWAYSEDGLNKYPFDQKKAKELIEKTGAKMGPDGVYRWTDGSPMKMKIETNSGNQIRETILQIAQEQYGQIGIQIDPLLESFQALTERTRFGKPDWEGFILGLALGTDPDPYTIWHSKEATPTGLNRIGWNKTDGLIEQQRNGPDCSRDVRKNQIHDFNKVVNEEAPWTFLYSGDELVFFNKQVQGIDPGPGSTSSLWNVEKWWLRR
jgi:peptide/nickel transport system substrate-binding protein